MNWQEYIVLDKAILLGKPTVKGTGISVEYLLRLLSQGWSEQKILEKYPGISQKALRAVFAYVQDCLRDEVVFAPVKKSSLAANKKEPKPEGEGQQNNNNNHHHPNKNKSEAPQHANGLRHRKRIPIEKK